MGVWFLNYGPQDLDSTLYDRRTWKMLAHGSNGYNLYMAHGGSNFNYDNDKDNAASYDYGAMVGQTGDLRPLYYSIKRANWFARSFESILANSLDVQENKLIVSDTNIKVFLRKGPAGSVAFWITRTR
ncbi:beta-galactosidase [Mucilaginibacter antarcticus]|uniref:beta-galactosidase n=1 Tax=Mucilaginibacter antarcticus TaxID=1855725 RepID=UPI00362B8AB8